MKVISWQGAAEAWG